MEEEEKERAETRLDRGGEEMVAVEVEPVVRTEEEVEPIELLLEGRPNTQP